MTAILEAVPNFSEGRDLDVVRGLVSAVEAAGAEVLDWSADPDHHRSVITFVGDPATVEEASVAVARAAFESIDLREHAGVHPRVGALDVLPFVPLVGAGMPEAVEVARRVGARIAEEGVPVYFYGEASDPPGRTLAPLRRGGWEAIRDGFPEGREPDLPAVVPANEAARANHAAAAQPDRPAAARSDEAAAARPDRPAAARSDQPTAAPPDQPAAARADASTAVRPDRPHGPRPHPTAGATCVGARRLLLAWNVDVEGVSPEALRELASGLRETGGGFEGLRVLALELPRQGRTQISMNLEDPVGVSPFRVFLAVEEEVRRIGGRITATEVVGMIPDALVLPAAADRLRLLDPDPSRLLSSRLAAHLARDPGRP